MNLIKPRSITKPVPSEIGPGLAGLHREHWDDRQDAKAFAGRGVLLMPEHSLIVAPGIGVVSLISGGAFASGMYVDNQIDVYDATQLAIDLSLTTHKWALYTNTLTPDFSADVSYSATNEITGTGYTAAGRTIAAGGGSPTVTESPAGSMMYDQADMTWPTASFTARGGILYADALAADNLIVASGFGADITATAATFTIAFNALGVLAIDFA